MRGLTEAEKEFIAMDRKYPEIQKYFNDRKAVLEEIERESGIGHHFQDDEGIVYEVIIPEWKHVAMEHVGINRTKRPGEHSGTLSAKRATELGY